MSPIFGKATTGFRVLGTNLEPDTMDLGVDETPVDRFFVCSAGDAPDLDPATWSMHIDGDAVAEPVTITMGDLAALPQRTVTSWLECTGNGRLLFDLVGRHRRSSAMADTPWMTGAMGQATWTGPTLASVLAMADLSDGAAWVGPEGLDLENTEGHAVQMSMPLDKALDPDTIIALTMNGEPLIAAHGAPARLLVPGWVGAYSVKWLGRIEVSTSWISTWRSDEYYVRRTADGTVIGPAIGHSVKSALALDWPAVMSPGSTEIVGYARATDVAIDRVEWSVDDSGDWHDAELIELDGRWTWTPFRFVWAATLGPHTIRTRAWDAEGNVQPETTEFSPNGILWDAITPHPIEVS